MVFDFYCFFSFCTNRLRALVYMTNPTFRGLKFEEKTVRIIYGYSVSGIVRS